MTTLIYWKHRNEGRAAARLTWENSGQLSRLFLAGVLGEVEKVAYGRFGRKGPRQMHKAVCSDCDAECEVPFKPT